ncbi:hypothetical protein Pla52o_22330 [Novipirellula galeiformis]|uniref:Uncharacterized protein n=1 Tax=Novipirellula galeiformis TaxID=2528004 RepID=A0A5C6CMC6_9BACT|nr:hypothetical protein Pla52o_22330 [Novipirellula galeiformis]
MNKLKVPRLRSFRQISASAYLIFPMKQRWHEPPKFSGCQRVDVLFLRDACTIEPSTSRRAATKDGDASWFAGGGRLLTLAFGW